MEIIKTTDFVSSDYLSYLSEGMCSYVDVARLLLELNTIVKTMAQGGNIANFYIQERALYQPLQAVLDAHLPLRGLVNIENLLYKTKVPNQKTDLSLREISDQKKGRLANDLDCTHFVEIKSVFYGESLSRADIENDLKKLVICEAAYSAVCFFVLVGLEDDLTRNDKNLQMLGTLGENNNPYMVQISHGESIWLRPAGSYKADSPFVYIWEVSATNKFTSHGRSGCFFSVFQKK